MKRIGMVVLAGLMLIQPAVPAWSAASSETSASESWKPVLSGIAVQEGKTLPSASYQSLVKKLAAFPPVASVVASVSSPAASLAVPGVLSSAPAATAGVPEVSWTTVPLITLELRGMDVNEVLKTIGRQGSLNIVTSANVRGSVSISLK